MTNSEVFTVRLLEGGLYENKTYDIIGNANVIKEYAEKHHYGGGVWVYVGAGKGDLGSREEYMKL